MEDLYTAIKLNDYDAVKRALVNPHELPKLYKKNSEGLSPLQAAFDTHNFSIFDLLLETMEKMEGKS